LRKEKQKYKPKNTTEAVGCKDKYIYMPTFNSPYDDEMLALFEANTNKTVVPVPAEDVCFMGGNVRCLSWQVKGQNANKILNLAD